MECPICLETFSWCFNIVTLRPCKHQFCRKCYHLMRHKKIKDCPLCRTKIVFNYGFVS